MGNRRDAYEDRRSEAVHRLYPACFSTSEEAVHPDEALSLPCVGRCLCAVSSAVRIRRGVFSGRGTASIRRGVCAYTSIIPIIRLPLKLPHCADRLSASWSSRVPRLLVKIAPREGISRTPYPSLRPRQIHMRMIRHVHTLRLIRVWRFVGEEGRKWVREEGGDFVGVEDGLEGVVEDEDYDRSDEC